MPFQHERGLVNSQVNKFCLEQWTWAFCRGAWTLQRWAASMTRQPRIVTPQKWNNELWYTCANCLRIHSTALQGPPFLKRTTINKSYHRMYTLLLQFLCLTITHGLAFYLKQDVPKNWFCLRLQVERTQAQSIDLVNISRHQHQSQSHLSTDG